MLACLVGAPEPPDPPRVTTGTTTLNMALVWTDSPALRSSAPLDPGGPYEIWLTKVEEEARYDDADL